MKVRGSQHRLSKLNESQVKEIRRLVGCGISQRELAERFEVSKSTISWITRGLHWKHVGRDGSRE
jgi:transcriptional regulator with XRE-family HTH domain